MFVYIREAHASDEWPLGEIVKIQRNRTLEDRLAAARQFVEASPDFPYQVVVDDIGNGFDESFCAWPERYYLFDSAFQLVQCPSPTNEFGFDRKMLHRTLGDMVGCQQLAPLTTEEEPVHSNVPIPFALS